jgi:hypothetical protein
MPNLSKKHILPYLQEEYSSILGVKISKEKAWELFKSSFQLPFNVLISNYKLNGSPALVKGETCNDLVMSLAGLGRFEVITAGARKSKAEHHDVDPRGRIYLSSAIQNVIYEGLGYTEFVSKPAQDSAPAGADQRSFIDQVVEVADEVVEDVEDEFADIEFDEI